MKKLIFLLLIAVSFAGCIKKEENKMDLRAQVYIVKTDQGFNIYSNIGELLFEYTKQNCDSSSLKTLNNIYETAKEFYDQPSHSSQTKIHPVKNNFIL
jgi:biotin synthase-like enzyme